MIPTVAGELIDDGTPHAGSGPVDLNALFRAVGFGVGLTIGTPPDDWPPPAPTATVPDVVGLTTDKAMKVLSGAGFDSVSIAAPAAATKTEIESDGVVTAQDPAAGTESHVTTTIKLTISTTG